MMGHAKRTNERPPALLKIPNEILYGIVSLLCISDLRLLGRVNCRLRSFVADYLHRYRPNVGILALPNELILEIVQYLEHQKDRSRLARASQRFYPPVMRYVVRRNLLCSGSSLLHYAAKRNLVGMARKMIHLGGDVNTRRGFLGQTGKRLTPLATAALYGNKRMVQMLLYFGATHFVDGVRLPLIMAIVRRHENVALVLSQELNPNDSSVTFSGQTLLHMACAAQLVKLIRYYLEHKSCGFHNCSIALLRVVQKNASKTGLIHRQLHEETFQIVLMLLEHGASPDICDQSEPSVIITARDIASRNPDPRIRNIFPGPTHTEKSKASLSLVGRSWMASEGKSSEAQTPSFENSRYAAIWDFLESPTGDAIPDMEEHEIFLSSTSKLAFLEEIEPQRRRRASEPVEFPPLSLFQQLGIVQPSEQHAAESFWAKLPHQAFSEPPVPISQASSNISQSSKKGKEPAETEVFPPLAHSVPRSEDTRKDIWAEFRTKKAIQPPSANIEEQNSRENDGAISARKKTQKKWKPLQL